MHGNDLPNILRSMTVVAAFIVIWFPYETVKEARKATKEEKKVATELRAVVITAKPQSTT